MRTLIFHHGALGDVLLSFPCIMAIRKHAELLDIVCRGDVGRLFKSSAVVHDAISSDSSLFSSWYDGRLDNAARDLLGRYHRVLVFTLRADSDLVKCFARAVPDTRVIRTIPPEDDRTHVAEFRMRQLPDVLQKGEPVSLSVPPDLRLEGREVINRAGYDGQKRLIVLHPGSGGKRKCWPLERYFAFAERMAGTAGAFILFLSGSAEELSVRERIDGFVQERTNMIQVAHADLTIVAGILAQCGLFVGNDSGISHLAAAIGVPVVALFGPTDAALWRPCGSAVRVVAAGTMEDISVESVLAAAEETGVRPFTA